MFHLSIFLGVSYDALPSLTQPTKILPHKKCQGAFPHDGQIFPSTQHPFPLPHQTRSN